MAGIVNGLFAGRAGIQGHGAAIGVLADNIANSNTVGFKASRPEFSDVLAGSLGGGSGKTTVGSGSNVTAVTPVFAQGSTEVTGRDLDVSISGNGFFIVSPDGVGRFYTRAGSFRIDKDGNLVNLDGLKVLGFSPSGTGGLQVLNVNGLTQSDVSTGRVTMTGNLDATSDTGTVPAAGATFAELAEAAQFQTNVDVIDSLGALHTVTIYFFHTDPDAGEWTVQAFLDGGDVDGGTEGEPEQIGSNGVMTFDGTGTKTDPDADTADVTGTITWANGSADSDLDLFFAPFTQFASPSNIISITQDGEGVGSPAAFTVSEDGDLQAVLTNGQKSTVGIIALSTFANAEGLRRLGNSLYLDSADSGEPVVGRPNSGQYGALQGQSLELSTSDLASDFIKLISLQRGFQGSSRIITSINDLLNEVVNLTR